MTYPWLKLQKGTKRDPAICKMPLAQQAVFYNLLQHAGLQEEEGAFDASDRFLLAVECAGEEEDTLNATIAHLLKYRVLEELTDGRLAFANYEDHQATKADNDAARQRSFYKRHKPNADLTPPNAPSQPLTEPDQNSHIDIDRDREVDVENVGVSSNSVAGNGNGAAIFDLPEPDQTLAILRQEPTKGKRLTVEKAIRECPDTSSPSVALEYVNWQDEEAEKAAAGNKQAKVQSNWVAGYVNAMHRSRDKGFHKKATAPIRPLQDRIQPLVMDDRMRSMREAYEREAREREAARKAAG